MKPIRYNGLRRRCFFSSCTTVGCGWSTRRAVTSSLSSPSWRAYLQVRWKSCLYQPMLWADRSSSQGTKSRRLLFLSQAVLDTWDVEPSFPWSGWATRILLGITSRNILATVQGLIGFFKSAVTCWSSSGTVSLSSTMTPFCVRSWWLCSSDLLSRIDLSLSWDLYSVWSWSELFYEVTMGTPAVLIALGAVLDRRQPQTFVPSMHEERATPMFLIFLASLLLLLLSLILPR